MCRTTRQDDVFTYEVAQTLMSAPQIEEQMRGVIAALQNNNFWLDLQSVDVCFRRTDKIIPSSERIDITLLFPLIVETIEMLEVGTFFLWDVMTSRWLESKRTKIDWDILKLILYSRLWTCFSVLIPYTIWSRNVSFLYFLVWRDWQMIKTYYHRKMEEVHKKNPGDMIQTKIRFEKRILRRVVTFQKRSRKNTYHWSMH